MLQIQSVDFWVHPKQILHNINVSYKPNAISMLVGPNGAGKSTLLKLLSQQYKPTTGSVSWYSKQLEKISIHESSKFRAVLSQHVNVSFPLTVNQVVTMGRSPHFTSKPTENDKQIVQEAMAFFNIDSFKNRILSTLSGGEQQRVHFARVAAQIWPENNQNQPKLLLLDEPLTFLDIYYQYEFMDLLKKLMQLQQLTVVCVVHDLNLALKFADCVTVLKNGKVLGHGETIATLTPALIQEAFQLKPTFYTDNTGKSFLGF